LRGVVSVLLTEKPRGTRGRVERGRVFGVDSEWRRWGTWGTQPASRRGRGGKNVSDAAENSGGRRRAGGCGGF